MSVRRRAVQTATVATALTAWAAMASCRAPTEVTLVITTDLPCSGINETSITVGAAADIEMRDPVAVTSACQSSGAGESTIGSFVVIPDASGDSAAFAIRVVSAVGKLNAADCSDADGYAGCIVARRELSFVPHTPLTLPIEMRADCIGVGCTSGETCVQMVCRGDAITNASQCVSACGEETLPLLDGGGTDGESTIEPARDAAAPIVEAGPDTTTTIDTGTGTSDSSAPGDASVLGACVDSGTSGGVSCGTGACASGQVCCVAWPAGGTASEMCTSGSACDTSAAGGVTYSALACRDVGDCASGTVCCLLPSAVSAGFTTSCVPSASCPIGLTRRPACRNACECPASDDCVAGTCGGFTVGLCGGAACP
jgi:hypothetical protein